MAYDEEELAGRARTTLQDVVGDGTAVVEKRLFGGVGFLVAGNMAVGVQKESLLVRLPPGDAEHALTEPGARPFEMGGRGPSKGWLLVDAPGTDGDADLRRWVERGAAYALSLPPK
jgi:TfoX/Sxy family transcriptional regulator of competence genes